MKYLNLRSEVFLLSVWVNIVGKILWIVIGVEEIFLNLWVENIGGFDLSSFF